MARTKTTWQKGQGGKPVGAKDTVPRSFKASVKAVYEQIVSEDPDILKAAVLRGLQARKPKEAFAYVRMLAEMQGELKQQIELSGQVAIDDERLRAIRQQLDRLAASHTRGSTVKADVAE